MGKGEFITKFLLSATLFLFVFLVINETKDRLRLVLPIIFGCWLIWFWQFPWDNKKIHSNNTKDKPAQTYSINTKTNIGGK